MPKKRDYAVPAPFAPSPSSPLKKQSRWDRHPWKDGELPARPLNTIITLSDKEEPYGDGMAVECPRKTGPKLPKGSVA